MRTLVVLAVVGVCSAVPFIQDTPEVAAEKARFFQAFQAAQQSATPQHHNFIPHQAHNPVHHHSTHHQVHHHMAQHQPAQFTPKWTGPVAATVPAGVNGAITPVGDTADVNAARQAFFNAYQAQLSATVGAAPSFPQAVPVHTPAHVPAHTFNPVHAAPIQPKWTGPVAATVPAGLPGSTSQVADTPEVQAAKAAFFQSFQRQVAAAAPAAPVWG
ncbi:cuticle protein CP1499-like [Palaemon carinicauda]|uniref:cuticle protein CP1499-like n=1 Tax=Palaemon carinicauda TaxID=392227 RepID=UPI0035B67595